MSSQCYDKDISLNISLNLRSVKRMKFLAKFATRHLQTGAQDGRRAYPTGVWELLTHFFTFVPPSKNDKNPKLLGPVEGGRGC